MPRVSVVNEYGEPMGSEIAKEPWERTLDQEEDDYEASLFESDETITPAMIRNEAVSMIDEFIFENPDLRERLIPLRRRIDSLY